MNKKQAFKRLYDKYKLSLEGAGRVERKNTYNKLE